MVPNVIRSEILSGDDPSNSLAVVSSDRRPVVTSLRTSKARTGPNDERFFYASRVGNARPAHRRGRIDSRYPQLRFQHATNTRRESIGDVRASSETWHRDVVTPRATHRESPRESDFLTYDCRIYRAIRDSNYWTRRWITLRDRIFSCAALHVAARPRYYSFTITTIYRCYYLRKYILSKKLHD